jgi:hypothetical protein
MTPTELMERVMNIATESLRLLLALLVCVAIYLIFVGFAAALECKERPDDRSYWTYRLIDGQRCWYRGHRVISKSRLHWPDDPKPEKKIKGDPVFNQIRAEKYQAPLRSDEPMTITKNGITMKIVKPNEYNELDAKADERPFVMFPEVSDKMQSLLDWWSRRWDDK